MPFKNSSSSSSYSENSTVADKLKVKMPVKLSREGHKDRLVKIDSINTDSKTVVVYWYHNGEKKTKTVKRSHVTPA